MLFRSSEPVKTTSEKVSNKSLEKSDEKQVEKPVVTSETSKTATDAETAGTNQVQRAETAEKEVIQKKVQEEEEDAVIFRVQITATRSSVAGKKITIDGRSYTVFEYKYKGAYRQTVGAFSDLDEAIEFQSTCRNAGYKQAFVAAFINNERVTDTAVFKQ